MTKQEVLVPDLGGAAEVDVIEVLVRPGDAVKVDDSLVTLESEKATMDLPSPYAGTVESVKVAVGDKVSEGSVILSLEIAAEKAAAEEAEVGEEIPGTGAEPEHAAKQQEAVEPEAAPKPRLAPPAEAREVAERVPPEGEKETEAGAKIVYASPSVRRFARQLGVDLNAVAGTGREERILKEDVEGYVKAAMQRRETGLSGLPEREEIDFSRFGEISLDPLSKIMRLSGEHLHRSWLTVPHVTQMEEADITDLEAFRKELNEEYREQGIKLTFLPFLMKAAVMALKAYPRFNASLSSDGKRLILKHYYHIGVAVDTPDGLLVPVIKHVDGKGMLELWRELKEVSERARKRQLKPGEMQGGCFTITSLGGIGGTAFTPIVNAPEVAILGVSRAAMKPVYADGTFQPRLMLPLSLSYDHRVIDGAAAARFTAHFAGLLADVRRVLL